jgi:pimeloyl-ACP methyl ester carboxylesterase
MPGRSLDVVTGDVRLAVETFGSPVDPPVVLVMGATASMLWWPESFCSAIADRGYFVVRYDHRDTGRSTTGEPGEVTYSAEDLASDLVGVMDGLGLGSAHLVGMSLGGYLSQIVAVRHPDRVVSLSLLASEPLGVEPGTLPGIDDRFMAHFATLADLDWQDAAAVEEFLVEIGRLSAGSPDRFDEAATRARVAAEIQRASNIASAFNHGLVGANDDWTGATDDITQPTLVIHGALDPILPLPNGRALATLIAGARLHVLPRTGHELNRLDLDDIVSTITAFLADNPP